MANKKKKSRCPVVVVGGGGHAKVLLGMLQRMPEYEILGYVDPRDNGPILGYPRLGADEALPQIARKKDACAVIGVGKVKAGRARLKVVRGLRQLGFALPPIVAPGATIARDAVLGDATVVMDGVVVQPGCVVGTATILNTGCSIDHDCVLGDDVHVAPGARLSGGVSVGDGGMVGVGAALIQGIRVVGDVTIGAGTVVTADCLDSGTYVGVPARRVRQ